LSLATIADYYR